MLYLMKSHSYKQMQNIKKKNEESGPALIRFNMFSNCFIHIKFSNVKFYYNQLAILKVTLENQLSQNQSSIMISMEGYFVAKLNIARYTLMSLTNAQVYFNGVTKFIINSASKIIYLSSSTIRLSNTTTFHENVCDKLISLNCKWCYLVMSGNANVTISKNEVRKQIIGVPTRINHPYPYCLFQYFPSISSTYKEFQINMLYNLPSRTNKLPTIAELKLIHDSIYQLTSHCKWATGAAFQNITPKIVNDNIITLKNVYDIVQHHIGDHTTVCYCPPSSHYNCSVDQLGPVYPGENLTVDLCLPYNNEEIGVLYTETYNNNLPKSSCKIYEYNNMRHIFHKNHSKVVDFPITSAQSKFCELFLTAQPNLFISYDAFYVHLLPCPLGFTLQHGICDCDPDLRKYIDECMISSQTVRRLSNVYNEPDISTYQYKVSTDCPVDYCLQSTIRINLSDPDSQCQPHRTGLLCSQCVEGYSIVLGSNRCRKCSNLYLLFIIYYVFYGLCLTLLLFILKLTVTSGIICGFILHVNMVWIISPLLHLRDRLVTVLNSYIYTANLGPPFEMCFYNGMNMYAKMWMQLTFPLYLILIAVSHCLKVLSLLIC